MKYLLLVVILAVFATVNSYKIERDYIESDEDQFSECYNEFEEEKIKEIEKYAGQLGSAPLEVKETVVCMLRTASFFSKESGLDADDIIETLIQEFTFDKVKAREIIVNCADKNEQKSTTVEWAYRGLKCIKDNGFFHLFNKEEIKRVLAGARKTIDLTEAFEFLFHPN